MRSARDSRSRERRVVGKAERTRGKANPRSVVASPAASAHDARSLDGALYCQHGEMENRIEERQLGLFADRTSAHGMRANRLRLRFTSMAYALLCALRRLGLAHTRLAAATCGSLRLEPLKIAARVRIGVRRIEIAMDTNRSLFQNRSHHQKTRSMSCPSRNAPAHAKPPACASPAPP